MARHKSNGRYVIPKKRIVEIIKANKQAETLAIHIQDVNGEYTSHYGFRDKRDCIPNNLPDIITEYTFKQTYKIELEIHYPFTKSEYTLIWKGNQLMQDLYAFNNL